MIAALARYNPFAVCLVAFLLGGLQNAGYTLQGADFPSGLVGVMQGLILFCALGGELLVRYRVALRAPAARGRAAEAPRVNNTSSSSCSRRPSSTARRCSTRRSASCSTERSGVLNLGVEGMMLVGAVMGFWAVQRTGSLDRRRSLVAAIAGASMALIHAFLVVTLRANQIVSGLALTIFAGAAGLSSYLGNDLNLADAAGAPRVHAVLPEVVADRRRRRPDPLQAVRARLRVVDARRCSSRSTSPARASASTCARSASRRQPPTRWGSTSPPYRYAHTLVGGAFAGVGGACFSLWITPQWVDGLTAGAGWIAIALVIFAFWRPALVPGRRVPLRRVLGHPVHASRRAASSRASRRSSSRRCPYVMTIVVLVLVSTAGARRRLGAPAALGTPYVREER